MPRFAADGRPNFAELYEVAQNQEGLFTTEQAKAAGYSGRLLAHYVQTGKFSRLALKPRRIEITATGQSPLIEGERAA